MARDDILVERNGPVTTLIINRGRRGEGVGGLSAG